LRVDNNVLSALARIERLELLPTVFEDVVTPSAVVDELDRAAASGSEFTEGIDAVKAYDGGWLEIVTPTEDECQRADEVRDHALSRTDAHCIAITDGRDWRLLTDDAHVGTVAKQRGVDVWDLALLLQAGIRIDVIETAAELSTIIGEMERRDNYRFSDADWDALFDTSWWYYSAGHENTRYRIRFHRPQARSGTNWPAAGSIACDRHYIQTRACSNRSLHAQSERKTTPRR